MVLVLFFAFLLLGCTHERDNPNDPYGDNYSPVLDPSSSSLLSSSSLPASLVPCSHAAGCAEISAEACFAFGGMVVASCPASSSSHLLAEVSSSGGVSGGGTSSSGEAGSSSSIPEAMVLCRLSDGTCPLTLISQEACGMFGGTPVQSCAGSSSANAVIGSSSSAPPSSSSIALSSSSSSSRSSSSYFSSSSVPTFTCNMTATTGTVGTAITPVPAVTCNGSTVTAGLVWTPANLTPTTSGSFSVSVSASSGVCSGMTAQCRSIPVFAYGSLLYEGQSYKTIKIGTQTWMAENLNYNASGSKCYGEGGRVSGENSLIELSNAEVQANCAKYGRLYNWSTAMGFASSCNSIGCSSQIQSPHQGICPDGWHLPSSEDWGRLLRYVDGTDGTERYYDSETAGKYLKATSGWNDYKGTSGNGTDEYGFSALPGGCRCFSGDYFGDVGFFGFWWSTNQGENPYNPSDIAYAWYTGHISINNVTSPDPVVWGPKYKSGLFSVRCVQD